MSTIIHYTLGLSWLHNFWKWFNVDILHPIPFLVPPVSLSISLQCSHQQFDLDTPCLLKHNMVHCNATHTISANASRTLHRSASQYLYWDLHIYWPGQAATNSRWNLVVDHVRPTETYPTCSWPLSYPINWVSIIDGNYRVITVISSWLWYFTSFFGKPREFSLPPSQVSKFIYLYRY